MAKAHAAGDPTQVLFKRSAKYFAKVQVPLSLFMIVLAPWAVVWLGGEQYVNAAPLLQVLAIAGLVKPWGRAFGLTLDAIGRADLNFKMLLFSMGLNLALNLAFLPLFGVKGAAWATGLGTVITVGVGQIFLIWFMRSNSIAGHQKLTTTNA